jgi:nicotinamidase-related amidase
VPPPARRHDLHGSAPDKCAVALLLIDWINDFEFDDAAEWFERALSAAKAVSALKQRARKAGVPVIYANDNFGRWRSDFRATLEHCLHDGVRGKPIAELLRPDQDDYFVLKPKHSGFHSTTLELLLAHLGATTLVLTGVASNLCVMFTAQDAYMRDYHLIVPQDCIASRTESDDRYALEHMAKVCKANTAAAAHIDFTALHRRQAA